MTGLARQCELIEAEWPTNREREGDVDVDDPVDCVSVLFAYISELQSELAAIKRSREQEQAYDSMCYELEKSREEIAALRRPVVHSDVVEAASKHAKDYRDTFAPYPHLLKPASDTHLKHIEALVSEVDAAQREKALVGEALRWAIANRCGNARGMFGRELNLHPEPPEHLRPILMQYAGSK